MCLSLSKHHVTFQCQSCVVSHIPMVDPKLPNYIVLKAHAVKFSAGHCVVTNNALALLCTTAPCYRKMKTDTYPLFNQ